MFQIYHKQFFEDSIKICTDLEMPHIANEMHL